MSRPRSRKLLGAFGLASAVAVLPVAAQADSAFNGYYVEGKAGAFFVEDQGFDDVATPPTFSGNIDRKWGGAVDVAAGLKYSFLRPEFEIGYTRNNSDGASGSTTPISTDTFSTIGIFGNVFVSPTVEALGIEFSPFGGGGLGMALIDPIEGDERDLAFAWQLMTGVSLPISDSLEASVGYRFRFIDSFDIPTQGIEVDSTDTHTGMLSLRYNFGKPKRRRIGTSNTNLGTEAIPLGSAARPQALERPAVSEQPVQPRFSSVDAAPLTPATTPPPMPALAATPAPTSAPMLAALPAENVGQFQNYGVQLAAYRKKNSADRGWEIFQSRNPELLNGLMPDVRQVDVPGKGRFFRLYASGLDAEGAEMLCGVLKRGGQSCQVAALQ